MITVSAEKFFAKVMIPYQEKWGYIWGQSGDVWTQEKQNSLTAKYNSNPTKYKDYKQAVQYGSKWIGKRVIDCSGLPYWALKSFLISIYHGSNSIWRENLSQKGELKNGKATIKLPKGAAIFTGTESNRGHIGIYDGEKYVIEAQGTSAGVTRTLLTNKKWTWWGLFKNVEYPTETKTTEKATVTTTEKVPQLPSEKKITKPLNEIYPTVCRGSKQTVFVKEMQERLLKAGYQLPKYGADGDFGTETLKAVKAFQKDQGLVVDGKCGPKTWAALFKVTD